MYRVPPHSQREQRTHFALFWPAWSIPRTNKQQKKTEVEKIRYRFSAPASRIFARPRTLQFELYIFRGSTKPSQPQPLLITLSSSRLVEIDARWAKRQKSAHPITHRERKTGTQKWNLLDWSDPGCISTSDWLLAGWLKLGICTYLGTLRRFCGEDRGSWVLCAVRPRAIDFLWLP